ncbi:hypothetical protein RIVM261_078700 [Rivularia sp. IAM M-261]|nr:hypothetical protein RIVM261_078700 [Rivularia sp. IAM M-261]
MSRRLVTLNWVERSGILPFFDDVVDIETGKFEKHAPANRLTWCLPRRYEIPVVSDWGNIRNWLNEATQGDNESLSTLLTFAAAVVRGRSDLQIFLYLLGSGGAGKGTYCELLKHVIGDQNTWSGNLTGLEDKNETARLFGKRLAIFPDQDKVVRELSNFKNITGGEAVSAKRLYKDGFNFNYEGMSIVTANSPALYGAGSWLKRRARVVNMNFQPTVQKNLMPLFIPEIAAFTRYLLSITNEEINTVLHEQYNTSGGATKAYWDVAVIQDSIAAWVEECVVFEEGTFTQVGNNKDEWKDKEYNPSISTLFGSYYNYCRGANEKKIESSNTFSPKLEDLCQKVLGHKYVQHGRDNTGRRRFVGIRLQHEGEMPISDTLTSTLPTPTTPPDNPESSADKHSDNPDNLLNKKINDENEIIDFPPTYKDNGADSEGSAASGVNETSGKGFNKKTMPPGLSKSSEKGGNDVNTGVSTTDNQNSGKVSVGNQQSMGASINNSPSERKLVVGDRCEYCGDNPNMQKQYSGVLTVFELKYGKVTLTKADGGYTTWLNPNDLRLL